MAIYSMNQATDNQVRGDLLNTAQWILAKPGLQALIPDSHASTLSTTAKYRPYSSTLVSLLNLHLVPRGLPWV